MCEPTVHPWRKKALKYRQIRVGKKCVETDRYGDECRLVFAGERCPSQERIRPAFEDAPFDIDRQLRALCIQDNLNILTFQTFANAESLAEQMDLAVNGDLTNEGHTTCSDWQNISWHNET